MKPLLHMGWANRFGPGGALWTPSETTTDAWWRFSDTDLITSSLDKVSKVDEKKGVTAKDLLQATPAFQPGTNTRTLGDSLNVLDFDGVDDCLGNTNALPGGDNFLIAMIFQGDVTTDNTIYSSYEISSDTVVVRMNLEKSADTARLSLGRPGGVQRKDIPLIITDVNILLFGFNSGSIILRNNGTDNSFDETGAWASSSPDRMAIGCRTRLIDESFFDGVIGEAIQIASAPTLAVMQKIEGYMAHYWGQTSVLPSDHPYKTNAPTV